MLLVVVRHSVLVVHKVLAGTWCEEADSDREEEERNPPLEEEGEEGETKETHREHK